MTEKNITEKITEKNLKVKNKTTSNEVISKDKNINVDTDVNKDNTPNMNKIKLPAFVSLESALGAVSMLAMKSANHKYLFVSDYEWLVIPPVALKQFVVFRTEKNEPIAFISWAKINEDVEKRLLSGSIKLKPQEWNSGDKLYIIDMISPFGIGKEILKQLNDKMFKDKDVKIIRPRKDGKGIESKLLRDVIKEFEEANQQATVNKTTSNKVNIGEGTNKQVGGKIINKLPTAKA